MKEKLTIEHLAPYLPYGIKVGLYANGVLKTTHKLKHDTLGITRYHISTDVILDDNVDSKYKFEYKPILRPMSELFNDDGDCIIESLIGGLQEIQWCDAYDEWTEIFTDNPLHDRLLQAPYEITQALFKNHYDVFGLIKKGLAVDINTIEK